MGNAVSSIGNQVSQGLNSPMLKGALLGGAIMGPAGQLIGGALGGGMFGGGSEAAYAAGPASRATYLRPDQMRTMGNQYQYKGAPPQMPQGMNVVPLWARQQQMQPQQFQPNWDVNAYNPNQNMQMRQQQMQQQMRGTPYQNMGMFGAFNPYMPRQR